MQKTIINQLKLEFLERLTIPERAKAIKILQDKGMTLDQIGEKIGKNKSTIHHWIKGRNVSKKLPHFDIDEITLYFRNYKSQPIEIAKLKQLILVLHDCIQRR